MNCLCLSQAVIRTRFATVHPFDWGCVVRFEGGGEVPAEHHPNDAHYRIIAARCGYGDDTRAYAIEHETAHLVAEEVLHDRPSRVLWGLAHGHPLKPEDAAYEECLAQTLQRYVRANEDPIIGGVDWRAMRSRFLEVLPCG